MMTPCKPQVGIVTAGDPQVIAAFEQACTQLELEYTMIAIERSDWREQLRGVQLVLWDIRRERETEKFQAQLKLPVIERMGIFCYPSTHMVALHNNKIAQTYLFQQYNLNMPATFISFCQEDALAYVKQSAYPLVGKRTEGGNGENIVLLRSCSEATRYVKKCFKSRAFLRNGMPYVYVQEFIEAEGDLEIITFGQDTVLVFRRFNSHGDFRSTRRGGGKAPVAPQALPVEACECALEFSNNLRFPVMKYDFIFSGEAWLVLEMSPSVCLTSHAYVETLFQKTPAGFVEIPLQPVGVLHVQACLFRMHEKRRNGEVE